MSERQEQREDFLTHAGWANAKREPLAGDASTRHYIRLYRNGQTAMLMDQPQAAETPTAPQSASPEERQALGYNATARLAGADCARFVAVAHYLHGRGLAAPSIYAADTTHGFLLIEDLGGDLYTDVMNRGGEERELYETAVDALVRMHAEPAPELLAPDKPLFVYDETAQLAEIGLLTEWFLPSAVGHRARGDLAKEHHELWRQALSTISKQDNVFVHRDYHAQNLIWRSRHTGMARAGIIDFQDALAGSPAYDLISLLEDARRDVAPGLACTMKEIYLGKARAAGANIDPEAFYAQAAILAAQRNAKIIGIFARLAKRDRKTRYLAHLPRVWRYMESDLSHPALGKLGAWYDRVIPKEARGAFIADSLGDTA